VAVTLGDQARRVIELDFEAIDDPDQLEHLQIVRRRFAVRFALGSQVEVLEEPRCPRERRVAWNSLVLGSRPGLVDVLLEAKSACCTAGLILSSSPGISPTRSRSPRGSGLSWSGTESGVKAGQGVVAVGDFVGGNNP